MNRTRKITDTEGASRRRHSSPGLSVLLAMLMAVPLTMACSGPVQSPQLERDRSSDRGQPTLDFDEFQEFEEAEEYSRPEYPVRRNPFRPDPDVLAVDEEEEVATDLAPAGPLQRHPLSSFSLVTIISETTVPKAMFVDPSGLGHFAKEGDRIGQRDGVIRTIRSNEVDVQEGGTSGTTVTVALRDRPLTLPREEDGLTEEERELLRRLLETDEGREALEGEAAQEEAGTPPRRDERFPGLLPPQRD